MAKETRATDPTQTQLRTFLIADMRGYTAFTRVHGDEAASALARRFAVAARATVEARDGQLVEMRGDEAMCAFASARQALRAAVDLQRRLRVSDDDAEPFPVGVGIGLDAGEAVPTDGGYRGSALNLAARLCGVAAPGEILASDAVVHLSQRVEGMSFVPARPVPLKGFERPVSHVKVVSDDPLPPPPTPPATRPGRSWWPVIAVTGLVALGAVAAAVIHALNQPRDGPSVAIRADSIVVWDPARRRASADIALPGPPAAIVTSGNSVWVGEQQPNSIVRINAVRHTQTAYGVGFTPAALAVGDGGLWIADGNGSQLAELDLAHPDQPTPIPLPPCPVNGCLAGGLAFANGRVWVGRAAGAFGSQTTTGVVWPATANGVGRPIRRVAADRLTTGDATVWTFGVGSQVADEIDTRTAHVLQRRLLPGGSVRSQPGLTFAFGSCWFVLPGYNPASLLRVRPASKGGGILLPTIPMPAGVQEISHDRRWLWVTTSAGELLQIDPYSLSIRGRYQLGHPAAAIAATSGKIWIALGSS